MEVCFNIGKIKVYRILYKMSLNGNKKENKYSQFKNKIKVKKIFHLINNLNL